VVGLPHTGVHEGRARVFGGTTTLWGGQALRLDAFDLQKKKLGPVQRLAHFPRGNSNHFMTERTRVCSSLAPASRTETFGATFGLRTPGFDRPGFTWNVRNGVPSRISARPIAGNSKAPLISSVLLHANVTSIVTNDSARNGREN